MKVSIKGLVRFRKLGRVTEDTKKHRTDRLTGENVKERLIAGDCTRRGVCSTHK